jgi:hypothetical protein
VSALEGLISDLREVCAGLPDKRQGPREDRAYTMADISLSAFLVFFMGSPSFLAHQRALAEGHGRSNCETLFGISATPTDNYIRLMLDGASPAAFDELFVKAVEAIAVADALSPFRRLGGRVLIALDGTEHFCSRKINCPQCSKRRRSDGGVEYFHAFLGASLVAPGHKQVLPLPPEFIVPQSLPPRRRGTARRSRTVSATPPSAGSPSMARPWRATGRSISATTFLPASRLPPPSRIAAATSS